MGCILRKLKWIINGIFKISFSYQTCCLFWKFIEKKLIMIKICCFFQNIKYTRVVQSLPFFEISMRSGYKNCKMASKNVVKISASLLNFLNLQNLLKGGIFSKIFKRSKKILFLKINKKWNWYSYFDSKWPLEAFFFIILFFRGFQKKWFLQFFVTNLKILIKKNKKSFWFEVFNDYYLNMFHIVF